MMGFAALYPSYGNYGNERAATCRMGRAQRNPSSEVIACYSSQSETTLIRIFQPPHLPPPDRQFGDDPM
jgi:hypothetical protein